MAIKEQKRLEDKESRVMKVLSTEYKFENGLFIFLSAVVLLLGILILDGTLNVRENFFLIGSIPKPFAITLIVISSIGLLYGLYPIFKPSFPEFKKISWPTMNLFGRNAIRTFIFIILLALMFFLYDTVITNALKSIL